MKRLANGDLLLDERSWIAPLSGQKARRFRRRWAAAAIRTEETIRTIKFPLEVAREQCIDSSAFGELHATLRQWHPGTLPWLLLTVHSSGFRIFSKSDEVTAFQNSELLGNEGYRRALIGATSVACGKLDPINLYLRFRAVPRPRNGTSPPFTAEVIAREYIRYFARRNAGATDPVLADLMSRLARRLEPLGAWAHLASAPTRGFEAWDEVMHAEGIAVPPLLPRVRRLVLPAKVVAKSTIAYDRRKQRIVLHASDTLPLLVSTALSEAREEGLTEAPALTQRVLQLLLTDSYSGLSWLWGSGLRLLKTASIHQCRDWFGVEIEVASALSLAAKSIPADRIFGDDGYAAYRADVGGMLAAWIQRHITGLVELDRHLSQCSEASVLARAPSGQESPSPDICSQPDAPRLFPQVEEARLAFVQARRSVDRLLGRGPGARAEDLGAVDRYAHLMGDLTRDRHCMAARVGKQSGCTSSRGGDGAVAAAGDSGLEMALWGQPLPRVPRIAATLDPKEQCRVAALRFTALANVMGTHAERLLAWCEMQGIPVLPFERLAEDRFRVYGELGAKNDSSREDAMLNVIKRFLDRFGRIARRQPGLICTRVMQVYDEQHVFGRKADLHRYFLSRQGRLYKPPFDRGIRMIVPVDAALRVRRDQLLSALGDAVRSLRREILERSFERKEFFALLDLEHLFYTTMLWGLPERLPAAIARPAAGLDVPIPRMMQRELDACSVGGGVVRQLFNLYAAQLRELTAVLASGRFFVRYVFTRSRDNALVYVPKSIDWKPPARLHATRKPIGKALELLKYQGDEMVSPPALLARAAASLASEPGVGELLAQAPHDWYYTGFKGGVGVTGLSMSKMRAAKRPGKYSSAFRLIGPSSAKTSIDRALLGRHAMIGDLQLICDRHFVQRVDWNGGGALNIDLCELDCSLTLGVHLHERGDVSASSHSMDRYVSVDLGEYGVGWTAFDARSHKELAHGFESVDSLRAFAKQVKAVRGSSERESRYGARFDRGMENARKRVAGEMTHAIESLLSKFRAFPVFETRARSPFAGNGEIERVHELVVAAYAFVDNEGAIRRRKAHWCGSDIWRHPYLRRKDGKSGEARPLNLFPGTVVSAQGTSQACSHCGRNAVETVRLLSRGAMSAAFVVADQGRVALANGTIVLHGKSPDRNQRDRYRRQGKHAPRDVAYRSGPIPAQRLIAVIKDNIRRPPLQKWTQSSSHSRYFCVYADCAASDHADINAARNIARRFRERLFSEAP